MNRSLRAARRTFTSQSHADAPTLGRSGTTSATRTLPGAKSDVPRDPARPGISPAGTSTPLAAKSFRARATVLCGSPTFAATHRPAKGTSRSSPAASRKPTTSLKNSATVCTGTFAPSGNSGNSTGTGSNLPSACNRNSPSTSGSSASSGPLTQGTRDKGQGSSLREGWGLGAVGSSGVGEERASGVGEVARKHRPQRCLSCSSDRATVACVVPQLSQRTTLCSPPALAARSCEGLEARFPPGFLRSGVVRLSHELHALTGLAHVRGRTARRSRDGRPPAGAVESGRERSRFRCLAVGSRS